MERRNTVQKELVLNTIRELKSHVTAKEVYEIINKQYPNIGQGTVYRNLGILADEGKIRRIEIPNGPDRFDFTIKEHYHVQCIACGNIFDVDMDDTFDLMNYIHNTHNIKFLGYDILFKGICPACQK